MTTSAPARYDAALRWFRRRRARRVLARMRRARRIGDGLALDGLPDLEVAGELRFGRAVAIASRPVEAHFVIYPGGTVTIGDGVAIGSASGIACHLSVTVGDDTQIGDGVLILDSDYHVAGDPDATAEAEPIVIGRGVSIGDRSVILRGSRIGDGAIVEPGSTVSGHVPAGAHVGGVPARDLSAASRPAAATALDDGVLAIARTVFRLDRTPTLDEGPGDIARWDSLGALSFLLSLEDGFGIALDVDRAGRVQTLRDVAALVRERVDPR